MRQLRLRSVLTLVGVIALSLWSGMQIERARHGPPRQRTYTVMRPVYQTTNKRVVSRPVSEIRRAYTVMRPVYHTKSSR